MFRRIAFVVLTLSLSVLAWLPKPAGAAPDDGELCAAGILRASIGCGTDYGGGSPGSPGVGGGNTTPWPPPGWIRYLRLQTAPDGSACVTTSYHAPGSIVGPDEVPAYDGGTLIPEGLFPTCPPPKGTESQDPAAIAARYWEEIPLPKPQPYVAPGWAITGKLGYLETNGELRHVYTNSTPVGPLEIVATGAYYVDWGDGESTGPHTREGKPWPEGEITHDYVWAKTYDIVVTERWTATWSLGGKSGTLRELRTSGMIDDFPARQIQAVIRS